jgi:SAM-dependent methyltransferase
MRDNNWFENWFDTNYYHQLYKHRNEVEAENFIAKLLAFIKPAANQAVLDLACGKGRHSVFLNSHKLNVTGIDLSEKNIRNAKELENPTLRFEIKDMRSNFGENKFSIIFNLFTSFGYFDNEDDDLKVLTNISKALVKDGIFVFDYLNSEVIRSSTFKDEKINVDNVEFRLSKTIENNFIIKKIKINDKGEIHNYTEKVKLIDKAWFEKSFAFVGLEIQNIFGNYDLNPYSKSAERLIIVAKKNV